MKLIQKKICLLGDFAVGKTSLVRRYVEGRFDDRYLSTIGVKISRKTIDRQEHKLNLIIWDLAGGEDFAEYDKSYLRGASGAVLVCDLTRPETLHFMTKYARQMCRLNPDAPLVIAANKADLTDERVILDDDLDKVCQEIRSTYLLTSAKTGHNVEASMLSLAEMIEARDNLVVS